MPLFVKEKKKPRAHESTVAIYVLIPYETKKAKKKGAL